jgi:putative colanic acid biosysnthesis UDP-glucose lipid carrier transferase
MRYKDRVGSFLEERDASPEGYGSVDRVGPKSVSTYDAPELDLASPGPQARSEGPNPVGGAIKRLLDLMIAWPAVLFLAPLFVVLAILVRLETPGPALFRQARGGFAGRRFTIYKFRTMRCEEDGDRVRQAVRGDDRITALGSFLRRTSIDELPQLFNVLKGDMSLVGPRPHALAHDQKFARIAPDYEERFLAKPGLTGLAQINGWRGETDTDEKVIGRTETDVLYVRSWSLGLDIQIIWRTIMMVWRDPTAF